MICVRRGCASSPWRPEHVRRGDRHGAGGARRGGGRKHRAVGYDLSSQKAHLSSCKVYL